MPLATFCALLLMAAVFANGCGDDDAQMPPASGEVQKNSNGSNGSESGSSDQAGSSDDAGGSADGNDEAKSAGEFVDEPPPIQILSGIESGYRVDEPTVVIAQSQKKMNAIERRHFSNGVKKEAVAPVSFKQDRQLVALFMPSSPRGSQVALQGVSSNGKTVKVTATLVLPGEGCEVSVSKTRPFSWVETRKLSGDVEVEVERVKSSAC